MLPDTMEHCIVFMNSWDDVSGAVTLLELLKV